MSKNVYFISDAHLSLNETDHEIARQQKLVRFLRHITRDARALYILGDLFEFWFEWVHVIPKYWFPLMVQLKQMTDQGIAVHYVAGNHDFYLGSYLQDSIGIQCHPDVVDFTLDGKRFFAAHGDGLDKRDWGYRLLRRLLRNPASIFFYRLVIPADIGVALAKITARSSRVLKLKKKEEFLRIYHEFANQKFSEGFDVVLLGHTHFPEMMEQGGKIYVNCGDWLENFSFVRVGEDGLSLEYWER